MSTTTFDTLAYSNKLQKAGMPREQAEAMAAANSEAFKEMATANKLATKQDLADLKHELLKWMFAIMVAQTSLIIAAVGISIAILK